MMMETSRVYIVKVALMGAKSIWRKIAISEEYTLSDLHDAIFAAFDRYEDHLYAFYMTSKKTKSMRAIHSSPEYVHPVALGDTETQGDATHTTLKELQLKPKAAFYYVFISAIRGGTR